MKHFTVIDNNTGKTADIEEIALTEEWADGLIYCDMEGFAITEAGSFWIWKTSSHGSTTRSTGSLG